MLLNYSMSDSETCIPNLIFIFKAADHDASNALEMLKVVQVLLPIQAAVYSSRTSLVH